MRVCPRKVVSPAMESERLNLVLVPFPITMGHVASAVEVAKLLVRHDRRLSITILILKLPHAFDYKITAALTRINFVIVPLHQLDGAENNQRDITDLISVIEDQKHVVKEAVDQIVGKFGSGPGSPRLAGFVVDMFCASLIDVGNEFGVPTYLLFTSGAAFLGLLSHLLNLTMEQKVDTTAYEDSADLLDMPIFRHRFPAKLLPTFAFIPKATQQFLKLAGRFREMKGVLVNTFQELEPYVLDALTADQKIPPVYPVGSVLNLDDNDSRKRGEDVMAWLDDQPPASVVFLCFGSIGSFGVQQVTEIAIALERSGHRFLWCLRRPPLKEDLPTTTDYENVEEVLPEGFLTRTAGIGKVIGWAPQVAVLGHPAVGGFISHCGWNSVLESLWFGVPLAAWPLYAEQQMNAFEIIVELGLGVEVRMDYRKDWMIKEANMVVKAAEIENSLQQLMDEESAVRKKVKEMGRKSREAVMDGGSSHYHLARFLREVMATRPTTPSLLM